MSAFLKGLLIGFSIAIPVGPIGMLCLRRSITHGRLAGLVSGLGAATADALYGVIAALGLSTVTGFLLLHQTSLQFVGSLFLLYIGITTFRAQPPSADAPTPAPPNLFGAYLSTLLLTLANPTTILSFLGIFASIGVVSSTGNFAAFNLVLGVFLGSAVWWIILSVSAGALAPRLQGNGRRLLNRLSGATITAFGLWQLIRAFTSL